MKILISTAVAALALFAAAAHASNVRTDAATSDSRTHINGPRDPYTDGANAGKFDVYTDGAKVAGRDLTGGSASPGRTPNADAEAIPGELAGPGSESVRTLAGWDRTGPSSPPEHGIEHA